jgi:hypothetical protein
VSVGDADGRVAVCLEVGRVVEGLVGSTRRCRARHRLAVRRGEAGVEVELRVDEGEVPRGLEAAKVAKVAKAVLGQKNTGSDPGVGADEACATHERVKGSE